MKLTNFYEIIEVGNNKNNSILINTLNGNMNVLNQQEAELIDTWKTLNTIETTTNFEKQFISELQEAGYLFTDNAHEAFVERHTLDWCKSHHEARKQNITSVVFVLTYQCNFACPYCYEAKASHMTKTFLTKLMVDQVFSLHNDELDRIAFFGGEPFLLRNKEIIQYIVSKAPEAIYSATTNGYYLEEFFDILHPLNISHIMVTLDGPQEIHNQTRKLKSGKETFYKVARGIHLYLKNSIRIKIRMNISDENLDACLQLRNEYINNFPEEYEKGQLLFELQPIFQNSLEERKKIEEKIYFPEIMGGEFSPVTSKYNMMTRTASYPLSVFVKNIKYRFGPKYTHCDAESTRRFYDSDGNIYSCILALGNPAAAIGTYYPEVLYKSSSMLNRNIETIEKCSQCKLRFICGGGCALGIMSPDGDTNKPNCVAIRHDLYVELPKLFDKYIIE